MQPRDALAFTIAGRGVHACGIDGLQGTLSMPLVRGIDCHPMRLPPK